MRKRHLRNWLIVLAALVTLYAGLGYLGVPWLVERGLEDYSRSLPQGEISAREWSFNPWRLELQARELEAKVSGEGVVRVARLGINLSLATLWRSRTFTLDSLALEAPRVDLALDPQDRLNLMSLAPPATEVVDSEPEPEPLRLQLGSIDVSKGQLGLVDFGHPDQYQLLLTDLGFSGQNIDTGAGEDGRIELAVSPEAGGRILLDGRLAPGLGGLDGSLRFQDLRLEPAWRYERYRHGLSLLGGSLDARIDYEIDLAGPQPGLRLSSELLAIRGATVGYPDNREEWLALTDLEARNVSFAWPPGRVELGELALDGGRIEVDRLEDGRLALLAALEPATAAPAAEVDPGPSDPGQALDVRIERVSVSELAVALEDSAVRPAVATELRIERLLLEELQAPAFLPRRFHLTLVPTAGGSLDLQGAFEADRFDAILGLTAWELAPWSGYLGTETRGKLSLDLTASGPLADPVAGLALSEGSLSIDELAVPGRLDEGPALAWERFALDGLSLAPDAGQLRLGSGELIGMDLHLVQTASGGTNLPELGSSGTAPDVDTTGADAAGDGTAEVPTEGSAADTGVAAPDMLLDGLEIREGRLRFEDRRQDPAFATELRELSGSLARREAEAPWELSLRGMAGGDAPVALDGSLDPGADTADIRLLLTTDGLDLVSLDPYARRYVGWGLGAGRLDLNLEYDLKGRMLTGSNDLLLESFELGERSGSEEAPDLPLKLAVALLQGPGGDINLNVPVRGDLSDPSVSVGGIVARAFFNLIIKAAASPFLILGSLLPDGGEEIAEIGFRPGQVRLGDESLAHIGGLVRALEERPGLRLLIRGVADPERDAAAIARERLESRIRQRREELSGEDFEADEARAVEALATEAGLPIERDEEGASDVQALRRELLARVEVSDSELLELARGRADALEAALLAQGLEVERRLAEQDAMIRAAEGELVLQDLSLDVRQDDPEP